MEEERKRACDRRKKGFPGELIGKGDPDYPLSARFQTVSRLSAPVGGSGHRTADAGSRNGTKKAGEKPSLFVCTICSVLPAA